MNPYEQRPEFSEDGVWYRTAFSVADSLNGAFSRLTFLAVNYVADVWLNGQYLGHHEGGYTPFAFDVSSSVRFDTVNVLAVRVDTPPLNPGHTQNPAYDWRIDIVPYYRVDWFNYGGIIHDVYLEFSHPLSVARADVVPLDTQGNLRTTLTVMNRSAADKAADVTLQVFTAAITPSNISTEYTHELLGDAVAITGVSQTTLTVGADSCRVWRTALAIPAPKLWSPHNPNLYILKATLTRSGVVLDEFVTQFGVRTATTSGSTFLLNGRPAFLPGIARHEDHPVYGRSMPTSVIYDDLVKIKSLNVAFVRTAHYPNHPYTYLITDRLGLAVMEEIPVWWFDKVTVHPDWYTENAAIDEETQRARVKRVIDYVIISPALVIDGQTFPVIDPAAGWIVGFDPELPSHVMISMNGYYSVPLNRCVIAWKKLT